MTFIRTYSLPVINAGFYRASPEEVSTGGHTTTNVLINKYIKGRNRSSLSKAC